MAAHSLRKEVGQNIKDKKRDKRIRDRDPSQGGSREGGEVSKHQETREGGEVSKHQETLSPVGLWGGNLREQHNQEGKNKTKNPTNYVPNCNSHGRSSPETHVHHQQVGAEQGGVG